MAASNDNQGLKIAVAAFVTLTVILGVTTYFGFSNYSQSSTALEGARKDEANAKKELADALRNLESIKKAIGFPKADDAAVTKAIQDDATALQKKVAEYQGDLSRMVQEYKTQPNADGAKVDALEANAGKLVEAVSNQSASMAQRLSIMSELLKTQMQILNTFGLDLAAVRKDLELVNGVNGNQLEVERTKVAETNKAKEDAAQQHEEDRTKQITRVDNLQSENARLSGEVTKLNNLLAQEKQDRQKDTESLSRQLNIQRRRNQETINVLERPQGSITFIDFNRGEVRTTITLRQGAKPQMVFAIFDRKSPGVPTDKPKGTIQMLEVNASGSRAKILTTTTPSDPIRVNDVVYSPSVDLEPRHYALVGKIDVDRDGRDDRQDLIRMIEASGGYVDYDLAPSGLERGEITGLTDWYVQDNREPFRGDQGKSAKNAAVAEDQGYLAKKTAALNKAHALGVQPVGIGRLLAMLGYQFHAPVAGRVEAVNRNAIRDLMNPKGRVNTGATPGATGDQPEAEKKDGEETEKKGEEPGKAKGDDNGEMEKGQEKEQPK